MSQTDYQTTNYPTSATASGGYGAAPERTWSTQAQRGGSDANSNGLIDQSTTGGRIENAIQDAVQGTDAATREQYAHESKRDFGVESGDSLDPYGGNPDNRNEAEDFLASKYTDSRGREYEGGASAGDA
ncbi:hypothetical protein BC835DRAFT_270954 [Cytidiella melzeri]|nr:hypothetical protein BC835DRAFT_270954 [Cytidiella melzeri]